MPIESADERRRSAVLAGYQRNVPLARSFLEDADAGVRARALGALQRSNALDAPTLSRALGDPDPTVRRRAVELVPRMPEVDLADALDDVATVAETAAWACGERGASEMEFAALIDMARAHDDALCREAAVAALGAIGDDRALPAVMAALEDRPAIRRRAVLALAAFEGGEVDAALRHAAQDRDWQVRQAAEDLLAIDEADDGPEPTTSESGPSRRVARDSGLNQPSTNPPEGP